MSKYETINDNYFGFELFEEIFISPRISSKINKAGFSSSLPDFRSTYSSYNYS